VLSELQEAGCQLSVGTVLTATIYREPNEMSQAVRESASAYEPAAMGFASDVDLAVELDCDDHAVVKEDDAFMAF
jgi:hypothetical protein